VFLQAWRCTAPLHNKSKCRASTAVSMHLLCSRLTFEPVGADLVCRFTTGEQVLRSYNIDPSSDSLASSLALLLFVGIVFRLVAFLLLSWFAWRIRPVVMHKSPRQLSPPAAIAFSGRPNRAQRGHHFEIAPGSAARSS
jgi:hypothetical protein